MQLTLQVTNSMRDQLGEQFEHVFTSKGGTIGRAPHNDWVLPDPKRFVSSVHASIEARDGGFYLVDTSMNGVYVDGSSTPLGPTAPQRLTNGLKLRMGNYRMRVVHVDANLNSQQQTLMSADFFEDAANPEPSAELSIELLVEDDIADSIDLEELLDDRIASANMSMLTQSPLRENAPAADVLEELSESTQPHTATVHRLPGARRKADVTGERRDVATYRALLKGLGLDPATFEARNPNDVAFAIGQCLRASIQGVKAMKAARARGRQSLDVAPTQQDVDDLTPTDITEDIADLLLGRGQIHRKPAENIADDVRALMQHQLAMRESAAAATNEFLDQLEPDALQDKLTELGGGKGLFTASKKASLWDQYCRYFEVIAMRDDNQLPAFIREEMARAYTARLQTLASAEHDD
ncbi:MAG: type VI secretion system-associated FHA domain protein TagH [Pseudomonadota bacterium]